MRQGSVAPQSQTRAACVALALVVTAWYGRYLLDPWRVPVGDILDNYFYLFAHLGARYRAGGLPLWSAHYYAGHPFFGNMPSVFYPGDLLFVALPTTLAFAVDRWWHLILGALAMYGVGRRLGLAPLGAFVAGVLYTCSGQPWEHVRAGHVYMVRTGMWFPVVIWAWLALWQTERPARAFALAALAAGCFFLSGHPQIFTYGTVAWGVLALAAASATSRGAWRSTWSRVGVSVAAGAAGLLLAAPQLLPLAELARHTSRAQADLAIAGGLAWPLPGWVHTLWPQVMVTGTAPGPPLMMPHAEHGAFLGAVALCFAAVGACSRSWPGRRLALVALVFGACYALGHQTPLLRWVIAVLPPLGQFRIPARMLFLALWGFALLAGRGADALTDRGSARRLHAAAVGLVSLTAIGGGVWVLGGAMRTGRLFSVETAGSHAGVSLLDSWSAAALWAPVLSLAIVPGFCLLVSRWVPRRGAPAMLAAGLLLNLGLGYRLQSPAVFEEPPNAVARAAAHTPLGRVFEPTSRRGAMSSLITGERNLNGSGPFLLATLQAYLGRIAGCAPVRDTSYAFDPAVGQCRNVARYRLLDIEATLCSGTAGQQMQKLDHAHAWVAGRVRTVRDEAQALASVTAADFDPATTVVLLPEDRTRVPDIADGPVAAVVELQAADHHRQTWRVELDAPGVFVLSELHYPGWQVSVDGERRAGLRANFLLRGVALSAGAHTVTWRYQPWSFRVGAGAWALGCGIIAWSWRRGRSRAAGSEPPAPPESG